MIVKYDYATPRCRESGSVCEFTFGIECNEDACPNSRIREPYIDADGVRTIPTTCDNFYLDITHYTVEAHSVSYDHCYVNIDEACENKENIFHLWIDGEIIW